MIVICDIDGCLADVVPYVKEYLLKDKADWKTYFTHTLDFKPMPETIELINSLLANRHKVIFVSGRPASNRQLTKEWLYRHIRFIKDDKLDLRLRKKGDNRPTKDLKLEIIQKIHSIVRSVLVIEDEPSVVEELSTLRGITILQVHGYRCTAKDGIPEGD